MDTILASMKKTFSSKATKKGAKQFLSKFLTIRSWLKTKRIPESEVMDNQEEVVAYNATVTEDYLNKIDEGFVQQALNLGIHQGRILDVGCGPGQILLKLAVRKLNIHLTGIDLSWAMIQGALEKITRASLNSRISLQVSDAKCLPFANKSFDLVLCNSVLHHSSNPIGLLNEISRVIKPTGALLIRDLKRPTKFSFPFHTWWFGRHYSGLMKRLYLDSLRASYTLGELKDLLKHSSLSGCNVFQFGWLYLGIEKRSGITKLFEKKLMNF